jgi:hypothetical protein
VWTRLKVIVLIRQFFKNIACINDVGTNTVPTGVSRYVFGSKEGITELKLIIILLLLTILLLKVFKNLTSSD